MSEIAENLSELINNFDPSKALEGGSAFYVEREDNPTEDLITFLSEMDNPVKVLYSGHKGSGKSTELNRLSLDKRITDKFIVVDFSVADELDIFNVKYIDLLFSIGARIFQNTLNLGKKFERKLLTRLNNWFATSKITEIETEIGKEKSRNLGAGISLHFVNLMGSLKLGDSRRERIRAVIEPQLKNLLDIINSIIDASEITVGKKILICIDDLDKLEPGPSEELFYEHGTVLALPRCSIIYTIPIGTVCSPKFGKLSRLFQESYTLPNVTIHDNSESREKREEGFMIMRKMVERRAKLNLFDAEALGEVTRLSGGVFRELSRLVRNSAVKAVYSKGDKIKIENVQRAASDIRNDYRRLLTEDQLTRLRTFYEHRVLEASERFQDLLQNLSLLEYRNHENWCDVNPIIVPLTKNNG